MGSSITNRRLLPLLGEQSSLVEKKVEMNEEKNGKYSPF
jgi:hypothetical protein